MNLTQKLEALGLSWPTPLKPTAAYVPVRRAGELLFVSGHVPFVDGRVSTTGHVGAEVTLEAAQHAAQQCALNALGAVNDFLDGDWSGFVQFVRLGVFVQSAPGFDQQHLVANGASNLLETLFGANGGHARTSIGTNALPLNSAVEVEMILQVR